MQVAKEGNLFFYLKNRYFFPFPPPPYASLYPAHHCGAVLSDDVKNGLDPAHIGLDVAVQKDHYRRYSESKKEKKNRMNEGGKM